MTNLLLYVSCSSAALMAGAGMYCFCRWTFASRHLLLRPLCNMKRGTIVVLLVLAIGATIFAQKGGGDRSGDGGESGDPPVQEEPCSGTSEVTNLCFTGMSVSSNDVQLSLAWPTNHLFAGDIVDLFAATSLVGAAWNWVGAHGVASNTETNWTEIVDTAAIAGTPNPPMMFFSASVRAAPCDLRDTDGDTLPDAYEFHNGTNPYVPDYALAPKLTVGPSGTYADVATAFAASTNYSIVELDPSIVHNVGGMGARIPAHPVMVCSPSGPPAVVRATGLTAFLLDSGTTPRTLFRNLYVLLDATSGFQTGFWMGGNLPWYPIAASATFEDIYVRAPHSGVEYFGWLLYASAVEAVTLSRCTVNAAGSEWVYGVQMFGTAPLVLDRCSFVNFPPNGAKTSCGVLLRSSSDAGGGAEVSVSHCLFDESFTNAVMFGRLENGVSNILSVADCLVPRELPSLYHPDNVSGLVVTNAALSWAGFPWPNSPSVALGMGALMPFANDPLSDTDGDGFFDNVEVYEKGTDPYLADSDLDGISDFDEDDQGTDPTNPHSFKQNLLVAVTNTVTLSHAAYLAWGYSETGWEANELVVFPSGAGTNLYVNASSNGAVFVKAFCDLDDDGEYSPNADILLIKPVPQGAMATRDFVFGDVDGDGITDEQERFVDHTDPYDGGNFRLSGTKILYTDLDYGQGVTNLIEVSPFRDGWDPGNVATSFVSRTFTYNVDTIVTGGVVYVKCLRDLDGDGELDVGVEQIVVTRLTLTSMGKSENATIGDYDDDSITDTQELQDGTDPYDKNNYAINLFGCFTGVFHTTNVLSVVFRTSSEMLYGPILLTNGTTWAFASNHVEVTGGGRPYFVFWDDADSNEAHEVSEASVTYLPSPFSHDMAFTNRLSYGSFDKDNDGMLDWWEQQHGLCPTNRADAVEDTDGDGLINLHEQWANCDPNVADGSNTVLSIMSRSIDTRLGGKTPSASIAKFRDYRASSGGYAHNFTTNPLFWAADVDTSCASMWNSFPWPGEFRKAGTLVSPRHVIFARHFPAVTNEFVWFNGLDGNSYSNRILAIANVGDTDIQVGLLQDALPESIIRPAVLLPLNFADYLSSGKYLPVMQFDYDEHGVIYEITSPIPEPGVACVGEARVYTENPRASQRQSFHEYVVVGDSGNPMFLVIGTNAVFLGAAHVGNGYVSDGVYKGSGNPFLTYYATEVQAVMDSLAPGYALRFFDFSPYRKLDEVE